MTNHKAADAGMFEKPDALFDGGMTPALFGAEFSLGEHAVPDNDIRVQTEF